MEKTLGNTDVNGTRKNVADVVFFGDGGTFVPGARIATIKDDETGEIIGREIVAALPNSAAET